MMNKQEMQAFRELFSKYCRQEINKLLSSIDLREKNMIILLGRHIPFASYSSASSSSSSEKRDR